MAAMEDGRPSQHYVFFCHSGPASPVDDPIRGRPKSRFPSSEQEIVQVATTPVPEPELTVEIGDRPTIGHLEETVLYLVDDYYTAQPVTPSLSASGGDHQTTVCTTHSPNRSHLLLHYDPVSLAVA